MYKNELPKILMIPQVLLQDATYSTIIQIGLNITVFQSKDKRLNITYFKILAQSCVMHRELNTFKTNPACHLKVTRQLEHISPM